ncbi:cellulase family glycosylhydrolase [Streptomyces sp. S.PNR 29]|uniref:cellulase family glycosylhydrolase n=1 Tax=Streptomyces sp. S.PNR 29 TaxID=2973805 RepID=UPI0025B1B6B6|nr:cellulase family glycosylhydrolase [Streptomyces sp. S.PNR 29]MDN0198903.1 cellulase family glycosylhydrolase [Streptomyces sp. S.PNR 29]
MHTRQRTIPQGAQKRPPRGRRLRRTLGLLLGLAAVLQLAWSTGAFAAPKPPVKNNRMAVVADMQPSWNLGNTLDAIPDETSWGNPPVTKALFDAVKAKGFRSVRIPVSWSSHQSADAPYTIDPAFMQRVRQIVDWAIADGLYVVLNVHHDSWQWIADMPAQHDTVLARWKATWTQIATTFKDEPRLLLFESVNEPAFNNATDAQKTQLLNELNTSFHQLVRGTGGGNGTRLLVLPTLGTTPSKPLMDDLVTTMSSLNDDNLVATVHYYGFWPFSANIAGYTTFEDTSKKDMDTAFGLMRDVFVAKGIPVYLGEYGLLSYPDYTKPYTNVQPGEALKYFERLGYDARVNGVTTALWDAGSFINRNTLQWRYPTLMNQITSSWTTRSGTASSNQVFVPASGTITDRTLTLDLNGTSFRGLWQGGSRLVAGRDYTVSGDRLTLTASALTRLAGDRAYGVKATLEARFSAGVPWQIDIISSDVPVLSSANGTTTGSVTIPTRYRGDVLATMEARYADGSNAGGADWTPYQEYGRAFVPDHSAGTLTLTSDFLSALKDGRQATLTFHFWSGAKVTYHVTRNGTAVIGSAS